MTPRQKEIARNQAQLDSVFFWVDKLVCLLLGVTPPEECPQPRLLEDPENYSNTDVSLNLSIENEFGGGTFTFTSAHDPIKSSGV